MQEFEVRLRSVQEVQEFVAMATERPFPVSIGDGSYDANAKCFMEMFCLDFTRALKVRVECSYEEFLKFWAAAGRFVVRK